MDGVRWWIVDEIARWWTQASQGERWLLMQRAIEGAKEASLAEVQQGALRAEIEDEQADLCASIYEAWASGKGVRRC